MMEQRNLVSDQTSKDILLSVRDLSVEFRTGTRRVKPVNKVSFDVRRGETLVVLGESGSGKSITFEAILGILDSPPGKVTGGVAEFEGRNLFDLPTRTRRAICGRDIGMIFQDPLAALNPVYTVGWQLGEMYRVHLGLSSAEARKRSVALLDLVGIPAPEVRVDNYPHEFSGGMRQRLVIAMALAVEPRLVIADEPTTALDVTIEAQILRLLKEIQSKTGIGLVLITHSMGVAAQIADRVNVMYAGRVVETGDVRAIFKTTAHPYTLGLLRSIPYKMHGRKLVSVSGQPPDLAAIPGGCPFHPRCFFARDICRTDRPVLRAVAGATNQSACHFAEEALADRLTTAQMTGD